MENYKDASKKLRYGSLVNRASKSAYDGMPPEIQEFWDNSRKKILDYAVRLTGSAEDGEDIMNMTFVRAIRGFDKFRGESSLNTWIYSIVKNLSRNRFHYMKRRGKYSNVSLSELIETGDEAPTPRVDMELKEFQENFVVAIENLSKNHREILYLRLNMGLSYQEIADCMGVEIGTVKSRVSRARESLVKRLESMGTVEDRGAYNRPVELERQSRRSVRKVEN